MLHFIRRKAAASACARIPVAFSKNSSYNHILQLLCSFERRGNVCRNRHALVTLEFSSSRSSVGDLVSNRAWQRIAGEADVLLASAFPLLRLLPSSRVRVSLRQGVLNTTNFSCDTIMQQSSSIICSIPHRQGD